MRRIITFIISFVFIFTGIIGNTALALEANIIKDGEYTIENDAFHMDKDEESTARKYLEKKSNLLVENGEMYLTIKFTGKSMMKNHKVKINNEVINFDIVDETNDTIEIRFPISSLKEDIVIATQIVLPFMTRDVEFRLILKEETLKSEGIEQPGDGDVGDEKPGEDGSVGDNEDDEQKPGDEESKPEETPEIDEVPVLKPEDIKPTVNGLEQGIYSITNNVISDSAIGYDAARSALNSTSRIEVKDGYIYLTLGFGSTNLMSNTRVYMNGGRVDYNITHSSSENNTMDIKFRIPSINTKLTIKSYIAMIERDIEFGITLNESSLKLLEGVSATSPIATPVTIYEETQSEEEKDENIEDTEEIQETEAKEYLKKYTINNEVVHDSIIGKKMARKYLAETSILEEIDGEYYLTLEFSGTNVMEKFRIHINGEEVDHSVVKNDSENNIKSFRFKINSLDDDIRVYCFINITKMNIDFGVKLDKDSMTLIDDKTIVDVNVSQIEKKDNKGKLPIIIVGGILVIVGISRIIIVKKRKKDN